MILSIESSCDDSSLALTQISSGALLYHLKISQDEAHSTYGGIVPEIASRLHAQALPSILAKIKLFLKSRGEDLGAIKAVAVTTRPGLSVTLIEGLMMAKALCLALKVPLISVNHLKGHIYSPFIVDMQSATVGAAASNTALDSQRHTALLESTPASPISSAPFAPETHFPMACLLISGGHTQIIEVESFESMRLVATSLDDSFGESFDKVAKYLGLGYPGGPIIEAKAREFRALESRSKSPHTNPAHTNPAQAKPPHIAAQAYPIPLLHSKELCFSFSGLKNAVRLSIEAMPKPLSDEAVGSICAGFEQSACEHLVRKCGLYLAQRMAQEMPQNGLDSEKRGGVLETASKSCLKSTSESASKSRLDSKNTSESSLESSPKSTSMPTQRLKSFAIVGGASANLSVRSAIEGLCKKFGLELILAPLEFCSDNAAMIGRVGLEQFKRGDFTPLLEAQIAPKSAKGDFL